MNSISEKRFNQIFNKTEKCRIAVIGDLMIDRYVWGRVNRISPEAPVPVIALEGESSNLGGAANVAANVGALGAEVSLYGLVGDDADARALRVIVDGNEYNSEGIITDPSRKTSVKTRVIAQNQHMVRIDRETIKYVEDDIAEEIVHQFKRNIDKTDAVILQDYNKGVLSPYLIRKIIDLCKESDIFVGVDPKHANFWEYHGVTLFKPNLNELSLAMGRQLQPGEAFLDLGKQAFKKLEAKYLMVTAGSAGMTLFSEDGIDHIPTQAHSVHDVSGAGDTVIATIMTALASGATIQEAAILATWAASVVIAEVGAVPVDLDKLRRAVIGR